MRPYAALVVLLAAATAAFAEDDVDPDLPVVSGSVPGAREKPDGFRLLLTRRVAELPGWFASDEAVADRSIRPGEKFAFAGLLPGRYRLHVEGGGYQPWELPLDVFGDVANVLVTPVLAPELPEATFAGKLTLGFDGDLTKCVVSIDGHPAARYPDGEIRAVGLHAGPAWITVRYGDSHDAPAMDYRGRGIDGESFEREFPITLVAGGNHADVRVERCEDVRLVLHSRSSTDRIDARLTSLDRSRKSPDRGEPIAFEFAQNGGVRAYRRVLSLPDWDRFECAGPELPLLGLARGEHRIRIEAPGYEATERTFDVAGPTRLDIEMKPLAGTYVLPSVESDFWLVEERGANGVWTPLLTSDTRIRIAGRRPGPPPRLFLAAGVHVLRAVRRDAPPSATLEFTSGADRSEKPIEFAFPTDGRALLGSLVTKAGTKLSGFDVRCFALVGDRWERRRAQDAIARPDIAIDGLAPGRYRLAFDEAGKYVFAEFEMGDADTTRTFTYRAR